MARPIRVEYPDAVYHVTARGNQRKPIYREDHDRERFLETLAEMAHRFSVVIHAFCLMPNHYHLLLETPHANLSAAAGWLQTTYSLRFNRRHRRSGHLFQGRFKAHLVEEDAYAAELIKYVHLNPVRPKDKRKPIPANRRGELRRYRWSSHRWYAGIQGRPPAWVCLDWLTYFGRTRRQAHAEYRRQIARMFGKVVRWPWADLRQGLVLGGESLLAKVRDLMAEGEGRDEIRRRRRVEAEEASRAISSLVEREADRRVAIWLRVHVGGERMTKVAAQYGYKDGSGVHQVVKRLEERAKSDRALSARLTALADAVSSVKS